MPAKPKSAGPKTSTPKRATTTRTRAKSKSVARGPEAAKIAERAYFIHLEEGSSDDLANWLRAERELRAA